MTVAISDSVFQLELPFLAYYSYAVSTDLVKQNAEYWWEKNIVSRLINYLDNVDTDEEQEIVLGVNLLLKPRLSLIKR